MSGNFLKAVFSGMLLTCAFFVSGYAENGRACDNLSITSPFGEVGPGKGPVWIVRTGGCKSDGGTSWSLSGVDAAIKGQCWFGNTYSAAIAAYSNLDYNQSTAFIAAQSNGLNSAKCAYKDGNGYVWPGYFTTSGGNTLQYGIAIRNPNGTDGGGTATGILFSCEGQGEFGKGAIVYERKNSWARGSIHFLQEPSATSVSPGLGNKVMTITNSGQVGIGVEPVSNSNKLEVNGNTAVKGNISCNSLTVTACISPWPDYVFNKNYKTRPLYETESFIKKNGHLPGMPSQKEVAKNGINVGEMQAKLLKSMEEMTLQMIALKKENDQLKFRLEKIEKIDD